LETDALLPAQTQEGQMTTEDEYIIEYKSVNTITNLIHGRQKSMMGTKGYRQMAGRRGINAPMQTKLVRGLKHKEVFGSAKKRHGKKGSDQGNRSLHSAGGRSPKRGGLLRLKNKRALARVIQPSGEKQLRTGGEKGNRTIWRERSRTEYLANRVYVKSQGEATVKTGNP